MATYDMTTSATVGVSTTSIASHNSGERIPYCVEAILDIAALIADGYTEANGDIFQLLEVPANTMHLASGAEILTAFNGSSPTVDIDFAAGDDIIDGGDVTGTAGTYLAAGSNGNAVGVAVLDAADTIDVKLIASSADVTVGKLRVFAILCDIGDKSAARASAARDALA
jgi:hypothetical protein